MAISLQISGLGKKFGRPLFEGVDLHAFGPVKIALIGDNGSGKSTFLRMLAGRESIEEGQVMWDKEVRLGYLEQEIVSETYDVSGGERKILRLTELFYGHYNVLLLDEPDNHLDLDHKLWFEELVADFDGMVIVISHDRKFLETGIEKIWNLEENTIRQYDYSYTQFREVYEGEMAARGHLWKDQEKERIRLEDAVKRFQTNAASNSKLSGRYHSMVKRYEKFAAGMVKKPPEEKTLNLKTDLDRQHKKKTAVHVNDLKKSYAGMPVLKDLNLHVFCKEKIAISAPNGSGKSTLLNILVGKLAADSGIVRIGDGLRLGYYSQEHVAALDDQARMVDELQKSAPYPWFEAIGYLKKFMFSEEQAKMQVKWLSGGQKSRLQLAKFLATNPDVLVLDEPTNHLDLKTVVALERFLKDYPGTLILVSHDRELVDNVVDKVYKLENGRLSLEM